MKEIPTTITTASTDQHLHQILALQKINLPKALSEEERKQEGFVTVDHDFDTLKKMNSPYPHVIAFADEAVVAYALVMLRSMEQEVEILQPMFEKINQINYNSIPLQDSKYFVMGQVCVAKEHRSTGVFYKMYDYMKEVMKQDFEYVITEVSDHNTRSLKAHSKQGFKTILRYTAPDGHPWQIILWDLSQ